MGLSFFVSLHRPRARQLDRQAKLDRGLLAYLGVHGGVIGIERGGGVLPSPPATPKLGEVAITGAPTPRIVAAGADVVPVDPTLKFQQGKHPEGAYLPRAQGTRAGDACGDVGHVVRQRFPYRRVPVERRKVVVVGVKVPLQPMLELISGVGGIMGDVEVDATHGKDRFTHLA